ILTIDPKTGNVSGKKRPNQIGLGHEIIHGDRSMRGKAIDYSDEDTHSYQDADGNTVTQTVPKEELGTVGLKHNTSEDITENDLRKEQRETKNKQRGAY
ncbi:MAG: type III secretion system effector protein, partial [Flavobacteriaceae bacterium]|nr:type III secretion system effector protein [Flavobacteriaceae bacterium]